MQRDVIIETERVGAEEERRLVGVLAEQDPSWGSMMYGVADGWAILSGPGLFVNQAMAAGLTQPVSEDDVDHVVEHATELGVTPAFELCDATRPEVVACLRNRGWQPDQGRSVLVHDLTSLPDPQTRIDVSLVTEGELALWQASSAAGWGHTSERGIAANDAVGAAAFVSDDPGLLLAKDPVDKRPLACAALRMTDGVATLGGMSTRPEERRRGAQAALVGWRLRYAADHGCRYAVSMTQPGSDSERNLQRMGFAPAYTKTLWSAPAGD